MALAAHQAKKIAQGWIAAWNRRDLDAILSHYAEDVEYTSPFVVERLGRKDGSFRGKEILRDYVAKALAAYPQFKFELYGVFAGVNSVVLHYRGVNDLVAAETLVMNGDGKIARVFAHYGKGDS